MKTQRNPDCMALNCTAPVDLIAKVRTAVEDIKVPCWTRAGHRPSRNTRTMSVSQFVVEAIAKAVAGIEASPENIEWAREKKSQGAGELRTRQPPTLGGEKKETSAVRPPKYCPTTGERDNSSHSPVFFLPCTTKPLFWGLRERKWGCVNAMCPRHSPSPRHTLEKFSKPQHTAKTPDFIGFSRHPTPENKKREAALLLFDFEFWWAVRDSDSRPSRCKRDALTS